MAQKQQEAVSQTPLNERLAASVAVEARAKAPSARGSTRPSSDRPENDERSEKNPKKPQGKSRVRYDRPGHLEERHAQRLLRLSGGSRNVSDVAFLKQGRWRHDELANELAEYAIHAMTAGGDSLLDARDASSDEEHGGPFVETPASQEFAHGSARTTAGFFREALPTSGSESFLVAPFAVSRLRRR